MENEEYKESFIKLVFGNKLITQRKEIIYDKELSEYEKYFFSEIGLPLEKKTNGFKFQPSLDFGTLKFEEKSFYIFGEIHTPIMKEQFSDKPEIYQFSSIWTDEGLISDKKPIYLNKDLCTFVYFLGKYNEFEDRCAKNHQIVVEDYSHFETMKYVFRNDYETIMKIFQEEDQEAMSNKNNFWYDALGYFPVAGYGDYLYDLPKDDDTFPKETPNFLKGLLDD